MWASYFRGMDGLHFALIALGCFLFAFAFTVARVLAARNDVNLEEASRLPLQDDVPPAHGGSHV